MWSLSERNPPQIIRCGLVVAAVWLVTILELDRNYVDASGDVADFGLTLSV